MKRFVQKLAQRFQAIAFWRRSAAPALECAEAAAEERPVAPQGDADMVSASAAVTETDVPPADTGAGTEAAPSGETDAGADTTTAQPRGIRRALAVLSNKWVWMPAAGLMLLSVIGAGLWLQAPQKADALQAELKSAQQKPEQVRVEAKLEAPAIPAQQAVPDPEQVAVAPPQPEVSVSRPPRTAAPKLKRGNCDVSDKESVSLNLKDCIDNFNHAIGDKRTAKTSP